MKNSVCLIAAFVCMLGSTSAAEIPKIPLVRTWHQLLKQPKFDSGQRTEDDRKIEVQIGMSANKSNVGNSLLIYCYLESNRYKITDYEHCVGPVSVHVVRKNSGPRLQREKIAAHIEAVAGEIPQLLFVRAVSFRRSGEHHVIVKDVSGKEIARTTIEVSDDVSKHPWIPLTNAKSDRLQEAQLADVDDPPPLFRVSNEATGRAMPNWTGSEPVFYTASRQNVERSEDELLPQLVPTKVTSELKASWTEGKRTILLESKFDLPMYDIHSHYLARWWINNKPYYPPKRTAAVDEISSKISYGKRVRLQLQFDAKSIGAKPGDRIGVQLMMCPRGWKWIDFEVEQLQHMQSIDMTTTPLITNRLQFISR